MLRKKPSEGSHGGNKMGTWLGGKISNGSCFTWSRAIAVMIYFALGEKPKRAKRTVVVRRLIAPGRLKPPAPKDVQPTPPGLPATAAGGAAVKVPANEVNDIVKDAPEKGATDGEGPGNGTGPGTQGEKPEDKNEVPKEPLGQHSVPQNVSDEHVPPDTLKPLLGNEMVKTEVQRVPPETLKPSLGNEVKTEVEERDEMNEQNEETKLSTEHSKLLSVLLAMGFDEKESLEAIMHCIQYVPNGKFDTNMVLEVMNENKMNEPIEPKNGPEDGEDLAQAPGTPDKWGDRSWDLDYAQYWQPNSWDSYGWSDSWSWWKNWDDDGNQHKYHRSTSWWSQESNLHTPNSAHFEEAMNRTETQDLEGGEGTARALDFDKD